jgi:hypothetical protein
MLTGLLALAARSGFTEAPATLAWANRYDGPAHGSDSPYPGALTVDASGSVYVTGGSDGGATNDDFVTLKYGTNGAELWTRRYNSPANSTDRASGLAVDGSGNVYVAGESYDGTFDYVLVKYDSSGNEVWTRRYERTGTFNGGVSPAHVVLDAGGNIYLVASDFRNGDFDYLAAKYSPQGDLLWSRFYNGPGNTTDVALAGAVDAGGNLCITGTSAGGTQNYASLSYSPSGDVRWTKRYAGPGIRDEATAIAFDAASNAYVTGLSLGSGGTWDFATLSYDVNGQERWIQRYTGGSNGIGGPTGIAVTGNRVLLTGSVDTDDSRTGKLLCYGQDGTALWGRAIFNTATGLATDSSGAAYVTGAALYDTDWALFETGVAKYLADGTQAWTKRWRAAGDGMYSDDRPAALGLDTTGGVYVTGGSWLSSSLAPPPFRFFSYDIATVKFAQAAPDITPPSCVVGTPVTLTGPTRVYVPVQVLDNGSGVASVELTARSTNCKLQYPLGTDAPIHPTSGRPTITVNPSQSSITVYAVKINASQGARVELRVADAAGNSILCDPVIATLEIPKGSRSVTRTYKGLPAVEHYLRLDNGAPGLQRVSVSVNGRAAGRVELADGEVHQADLQQWYRAGDRNQVQVTAKGAPGSRAILMIGDASMVNGSGTHHQAALPSAPAGVNLDWGG